VKKLRVGQIGIGHNHGDAKMEAIRKFPHLFEVVGYAEEDEAWVEKRGGFPMYADLARMSVNEIIEKSDLVLIESDVWDLIKYGKMAIDAGKHIHLDKPAGGTLEDFEELLRAAEEKKLIVQLGYMYRYNPAVKKCFELIELGELGEIYSINAEMSTFHSPEYKNWLRNFNGGIMYILGSHLIDLVVYILGEPQRVEHYLKHTGLDEIDVEDNNLVVFEYEKALARIFVSSVEVNGWGRRQLVVSGSRGTVSILPLENVCKMTFASLDGRVDHYADIKDEIEIEDNSVTGRYDEMVNDLYAYVTGEKENPFSYAHELAVARAIDRAVGGARFRDEKIHG
jgi:predicted dehydrogenase